MRTYEELKTILTNIKNNEHGIPDGIDINILITDMLRFIGHTDFELRDALIYSTFNTWGEEKILSTAQMKHILDTCIDEDHLFFGIGEKASDSVFTRSFSSLLISVALCMHEEDPFLTDADIQSIKQTILCYVKQEKDYRGYVEGKGWAHAIAHIADALANIVFLVGRDGLLEVLNATKTLVAVSDEIYCAGECERVSDIVINTIYTGICEREILTRDDIIHWLDGFIANKDWWSGTTLSDYYLLANKKTFTRSLYFKLLIDEDIDEVVKEEICKYLFDVIKNALQ